MPAQQPEPAQPEVEKVDAQAAEFEEIKQKAAAEAEQETVSTAAQQGNKGDDVQIIAQEVDDVRALLEKYHAQLEARVSALEKQLKDNKEEAEEKEEEATASE